MNRRQFTANIAKLLQVMIDDGHSPIIDYVLRSAPEQKRLFDLGRSKCDGTNKISQHQKALAMDIYFVLTNDEGDPETDFGYEKTANLAVKYHAIWVAFGGKEMIDWDKGHYES